MKKRKADAMEYMEARCRVKNIEGKVDMESGEIEMVRERSMSRIPVFSTSSHSNNVGFNYSYNL